MKRNSFLIALAIFLFCSTAFGTVGSVFHVGEILEIKVQTRPQNWKVACFKVRPFSTRNIPPQGIIIRVNLYMPKSGWSPAQGYNVSHETTQSAKMIFNRHRRYNLQSFTSCFPLKITGAQGHQALGRIAAMKALLPQYRLNIFSNGEMHVLDFHRSGGWIPIGAGAKAKAATRPGIRKTARTRRQAHR